MLYWFCNVVMQLFRCFKPLFQICDDVVDVLCADGQPDRSREDALVSQFFLCKLGVGRSRRMDHQALHVRHVGQQGEDLQAVDELLGRLLPAFDLKGEDGSAAVREVLFIQRVLRVIRQRRVIDLRDLRMRAQILYDLLRIFHMPFDSE